MDDLLPQLRAAAQADDSTQWYDVVSDSQVEYVESAIGIEFPALLKQCYTQISNGGFGPGYGITGLPGGHESSWGDLIETVEELRRHEDCEEAYLPLIDWGCGHFTCIDCDDEDMAVTLKDGDFHHEEFNLRELMYRWCRGEDTYRED
jgi:hypothetical protein